MLYVSRTHSARSKIFADTLIRPAVRSMKRPDEAIEILMQYGAPTQRRARHAIALSPLNVGSSRWNAELIARIARVDTTGRLMVAVASGRGRFVTGDPVGEAVPGIGETFWR